MTVPGLPQPVSTSPDIASIAARAKGANSQALRGIAQEFESVFLANMLNAMFAGVETDGPFGGGSAEESWRGLLLEEYGKSITEMGGVGITDAVHAELIALQEITR